MWVSVIYNLAILIGIILSLPRQIYQIFKGKRGGESIKQRLGIVSLPPVEPDDQIIWIHAVSLGETKAVAPLAQRFYEENPKRKIIISSVTETGHQEAQHSLSFAYAHLYLPFDFSPLVKPLIDHFHPSEVIVVETDYWFNFLRLAKDSGAEISVVNGKISKRSFERYASFRFFSKRLFDLFDKICAQNSTYAQRFKLLGIPSDKIEVTGNLKFDGCPPELSLEERVRQRNELSIKESDEIVVAGSTHEPEEEFILNAFKDIWDTSPEVKLLLVPRHPDRFAKVAKMIEDKKISYGRYSQMADLKGDEKVILVDAMGVLLSCYAISDLAIVAGSFTPKVGGHNILEPCCFGIPVLFGPHMQTQEELRQLVLAGSAGKQVEHKELAASLTHLLNNHDERRRLGVSGKALIEANKGSVDRTFEKLRRI